MATDVLATYGAIHVTHKVILPASRGRPPLSRSLLLTLKEIS